MTQEQKAKAYDEALERARELSAKWTGKNKDFFIGDYAYIFPELRESEDERIRKWLYDYINNCPNNNFAFYGGGVGKDAVLNYLEKQKELPFVKDVVLGYPGLYYYDGERMHFRGSPAMEEKQKPPVDVDPCDASCDAYYQRGLNKGYELGFEAGRKEQKPNSTEDMPYVADEHFFEREPADTFKYKLAEYMTRCCTKKEGPYGYEYGISAESILKMAKEELIKRGVVQKPVECLKAERDGWYVCIKDFYAGGKKQCSIGDLVQAKGGMYMMGKEDISEWFRRAYYEEVRDAFGPNTDTNIPEQKPAEWSEEDEKMIDTIVSTLGQYIDYKAVSGTGSGYATPRYSKEIDWLKSLRPSWKPSEVHLSALLAIFNDPDNIGSQTCQLALTDLYEQLKKL